MNYAVGFRHIEGVLAQIIGLSAKNDDESRAITLAYNLFSAFLIEGFVNDVLERHLSLNADDEVGAYKKAHPASSQDPKTIIKIKVIDKLGLDITQIQDAFNEIELLFAARNQLVHPKSLIGEQLQKVRLSDWMGYLLQKDTLESIKKSKVTLVNYVLDNSKYEYPLVSESIIKDYGHAN